MFDLGLEVFEDFVVGEGLGLLFGYLFLESEFERGKIGPLRLLEGGGLEVVEAEQRELLF